MLEVSIRSFCIDEGALEAELDLEFFADDKATILLNNYHDRRAWWQGACGAP